MQFFSFDKNDYGEFIIVDDGYGISQIALKNNGFLCGKIVEKETPLLAQAKLELREFFTGKRKSFDVPLSLHGTDFQMKVWQKLREIHYGQTYTYGQLATSIGNPKAARAVGMANHRNPILFMVPCHRVIGSNGALTGYAAGLDIKEKLLQMEKEFR